MAPLARALTSTFRASRCAVQQRPGVNPLSSVLRRDPSSIRTYAEQFQRTKPHVNIGKFQPILKFSSIDESRYNWPC